MPIVSAIITTFNRRHLLRGAIRSVLAQTFPDFELLVLDNSSTDGTADEVAAHRDARLQYLPHPPMTIGEARNFGVEQARGEYIAFLDDDDEWLPDKLALQYSALARSEPDVGLIYGSFVRIDGGKPGASGRIQHPKLRGRILVDLLWQRDPFTGSASNPMIPGRVLRALGGYDPSLTTSEDWELYLRLAEKYRVESIPEVVVRIRSHSGHRLGDRILDAGRAEEKVLQRYSDIMDEDLRSYYLQKIGGKLIRAGDVTEGRRKLREAIKVNRANVLAIIQYLISFLGPGAYRSAHHWYQRLRKA